VTNGNDSSTAPVIDGAGATMAFHSMATNLAGATKTTEGIIDLFTANLDADPVSFASPSNGDGGELATFPDMSANGAWIVWTQTTSGPSPIQQVWHMEVATGTKVQISAGNRDSGSVLSLPGAPVDNEGNVVFQSLADGLVTGDEVDTEVADKGWDVHLWTAASSTITKMSGSSSTPNFLFPGISADGSRITFNSAGVRFLDDRNVYITTSAGGEPTDTDDEGGISDIPRVSDNGSRVVFRTNSDFAGGSLPKNVALWTSAGVTRVTNFPGDISDPAISGDGQFVAFSYADQIHRARIAPLSSEIIQISDNTVLVTLLGYPNVNGDGSIIVFSQSLGAETEIIRWNADEDDVVVIEPPCGSILNDTFQGSSGVDGRIARLYAAYFLRNPDAAGFAFWQSRIAAGEWTNDYPAQFFSESAEFKALYGTGLSDEQFINLLYTNVLCRDGDTGGIAFWLGRMQDDGWTRGQVALGFSDAEEFRTRTNSQ
jgi:Tol biopolymer transport system component